MSEQGRQGFYIPAALRAHEILQEIEGQERALHQHLASRGRAIEYIEERQRYLDALASTGAYSLPKATAATAAPTPGRPKIPSAARSASQTRRRDPEIGHAEFNQLFTELCEQRHADGGTGYPPNATVRAAIAARFGKNLHRNTVTTYIRRWRKQHDLAP